VLDEAFAGLERGATRIAKGPNGTEIVPADMTYYEWLKTQPKEFQNDAIGPTRAKLLRDGGLDVEKFAKLNLGRDFTPLTLAQMREKEGMREVFDKALGKGRLRAVADKNNQKDLQSGTESSILNNKSSAVEDITENGKYRELKTEAEFVDLASGRKITQEEYDIIANEKTGYIACPNGYRAINDHLRYAHDIESKYVPALNTLTAVTERNSLSGNYIGYRRVERNYVEEVFGLREGHWLRNHDKGTVEKALEAIKGLVGKEYEDKAFTSISMVDALHHKGFTDRPVKFIIQMPEGTKGLVTDNIKESEFIAMRGSKLEILGADMQKDVRLDVWSEEEKEVYTINIYARIKGAN